MILYQTCKDLSGNVYFVEFSKYSGLPIKKKIFDDKGNVVLNIENEKINNGDSKLKHSDLGVWWFVWRRGRARFIALVLDYSNLCK